MPGESGNKYSLTTKIGAGSYGTAWKAQLRADPSQEFVIKRVSLSGMRKSEIEDALREAQLLELLDHPNVLQHVEHFRDQEGYLCIVTRLANRGDVQAKVKEAARAKQHFAEETVWSWLIQLCCALKHVHDRKILHRDIKTANIFLNQEDQGDPTVKLGDFGIAKVLEHTDEKAHTAVGTPYYMSPELCQNKPYDAKSDMWAVGCVLYELCTLKNPFDAHNFNGLCIKILRGKYESIPRCYSRELSDVVTCLLEQQSSRRPDVNQLLDMPALKNRIGYLSKLSPEIIQDEFSHTALHGYRASEKLSTPRTSAHKPASNRRPSSSRSSKAHPPPSPRSRAPSSAVITNANKAKELEGAIHKVKRQTEDVLQAVEQLAEADRKAGFCPDAKFHWMGDTLKLSGNSEHDSNFSRVESLRVFLEKSLTPEVFLKAYKVMCSVTEDDDENELEKQLLAIVGQDKGEFLNTICQLIFCEDRTFDQDKEVKKPQPSNPAPKLAVPGARPGTFVC